MNIEEIRNYCLSKKSTSEDFPFDETTLVFRVMNKIFALIDTEDPNRISLKCAPDYALELREQYEGVKEPYHLNKKCWNLIDFNSDVSDSLICNLVDHSYDEVVKKMPKKLQTELRKNQ
jgi:predicted DNA-binding protein (MmcQ/YjbR family)